MLFCISIIKNLFFLENVPIKLKLEQMRNKSITFSSVLSILEGKTVYLPNVDMFVCDHKCKQQKIPTHFPPLFLQFFFRLIFHRFLWHNLKIFVTKIRKWRRSRARWTLAKPMIQCHAWLIVPVKPWSHQMHSRWCNENYGKENSIASWPTPSGGKN